MDGWPRQALAAPLDPEQADHMLREGGYGLRVQRRGLGHYTLVGSGTGAGLPLGCTPTWTDLYRALARLRRTRRTRCPESQRRLTESIGLRPVQQITAQPATRRLAEALESDHLLRMHGAILRPENVECGVHRGEIWPPHPLHPGGTAVVSMDVFTRRGPRPLREVIAQRHEQRENELDSFVEYFLRPLVRLFRIALDGHEIGIFGLGEHGCGVELSPELQATGRVVIGAGSPVHDLRGTEDTPARRDAVAAGVETLLDSVHGLGSAFRSLGVSPERDVRAAVDAVLTAELRYLEPRTAQVLAGEHRLRTRVHTVAPDQDDVLKQVLRDVEDRTRQRRRDQRLRRPAVVVDVDLCALVPLRRTLDAVRALSGPRPGAPDGIAEFARPEELDLLPTYAESTWWDFVESSGLAGRYPEVDWRGLHAEFFRTFARPWENLRTDSVAPGLARFVWDVQDAGGQVVFCTGRRERVRAHTEEVLAAAGVPDSRLLCMPDDRTRPISELKVEQLRALGDVEVVAVFDDLLANRIAITKEFESARAVAVELPGLVSERRPGHPPADRAPVISSFETSPRRRAGRRGGRGPVLSHAHSLEELQIGALRSHRQARRWAVHLSAEQSYSIVDSIVSAVDGSAVRTASAAESRFEVQGPVQEVRGDDAELERVVAAMHHVFTRKQFFKGSRSHYRPADMLHDVRTAVRAGRPIDVVLLGFPVKQCLNRLKAFGPLPDLAELGGLARLRELQRATTAIYRPGLRFHILTDGRHFRSRPQALTGAYSRKLREYAGMVGIGEIARIEEIDEVAGQRLGWDVIARRPDLIRRYRAVISEALADVDIADNPLRALADLPRTARRTASGHDATVVDNALTLLGDMMMSLVYSVPVPFPNGVDRLGFSAQVFDDLYNLDGAGVPGPVRYARGVVLRRAFRTVIRYLATLQVDEELGYDAMFPSRVRLTVSAARSGRCGFTYLGGSGQLPWQGTGAVDARGQLAVDFAISLLDQGFVPVYSPLIGPRQPWMMVPAQFTRLVEPSGTDPGGVRLIEEFAAQIRLRRK